MKLITKTIVFSVILSAFNTNEAFATKKFYEAILASIDSLTPLYKEEKVYRISNNYSDISDPETRQRIEEFCSSNCTAKTCGKYGFKREIAEGCQLICPWTKISDCMEVAK